MTNPIIAGDVNPSAPDTLGASGINIPGNQLPTTTGVVNAINAANTKVGPGHFTQLSVDGPSAFNGPVYFGASQHTAWFDCSPATVDPTVVLDFAGGPQQYLFLTRDTIVWLPTTDQQEGMFFVMVQQDAVGGWDLTWKINNPTTDGSAVVIWLTGEEPVMSAAADSVRLYTFTWCQNLNGGLGAYVGSSTTDDVYAWAKAASPPQTINGDFTVVGNFRTTFTHGQFNVLMMPAANNSGGAGDAGLYQWVSEPGATWTGAGIARNIRNSAAGFPRVNTGLSGQMMRFGEDNIISFIVETSGGTRYTPLSLNGNDAVIGGSLTVGGQAAVVTNDSRLSDARPASDVYAWAKAAAKPAYSAAELLGSNFISATSGNPLTADSLAINGIGYVGGLSLLGQSDGAVYGGSYSADWVHEIFGDFRTGQIVVRGKNSGTWQAWRRVYDSGNITRSTADPSGGADGDIWMKYT